VNDESDTTQGDDEILDLVRRLSRPLPSGDQVIERAAILAAGADFAKVIDWVVAHDGRPEETVAAAPSGGLHGSHFEDSAARPAPPHRYILPGAALG
jgi:hypothetical protein